jgi:uncharacterized membrane protein SpoIIM required for sporulation
MEARRQKKKKSTMRELAVGGGLMALFLPVIVLAVLGALIGVAVGAAYTFNIIGDGVALWPLLVVYGALLLAMLIFAYKFSARFALLTRRLIGLIREKQRIRTETSAAGSADYSKRIESQSLYEDDPQSSQHNSS